MNSFIVEMFVWKLKGDFFNFTYFVGKKGNLFKILIIPCLCYFKRIKPDKPHFHRRGKFKAFFRWKKSELKWRKIFQFSTEKIFGLPQGQFLKADRFWG